MKIKIYDIFNKTYSMANTIKLLGSEADGISIFNGTAQLENGSLIAKPFDLIRLIKFGNLDQNVNPKTPINKRPSWTATENFVGQLQDIRKQVLIEKYGEGREWINELELTENNEIASRRENLEIIFQNDTFLSGIYYNELTGKRMYKAGFLGQKEGKPWRDGIESELYIYLDKIYKFTSRIIITDVLSAFFDRNVINPVREYLISLPIWDGTERVETLFCRYLGAEDNAHNRVVTRRKMIATVARIFKPGCKHDECLILTGSQGMGKSSMLKKLTKEEPDWFNERLGDLDKRDTLMEIQKWIIEASELDSLRKAEATELKSFISRTVDTFKMPYAHNTIDKPRCCSFFGTTNAVTDIINDPTGGRRFWIVSCDKNAATKDVFEDLPGEVDQIWAEALYYYMSGEQWHLTPEEEELAKEVQDFYKQDLLYSGEIQEYLDRKLPQAWDSMSRQKKRTYLQMNPQEDISCMRVRDVVCVQEIWAEGIGLNSQGPLDKFKAREISEVMNHLPGWQRGKITKRFGEYGPQRYWERV